MKRFWFALTVALFFYAKMDILIWQRIFETNELINIGVGVYHWGWVQALFGFMVLGIPIFYPNVRRMITYPISLAVLAFSGIEDILYYWLDGKSIPDRLPWLNSKPLLFRPVTMEKLLLSAAFWLLVVLTTDLLGEYLERKLKAHWEAHPHALAFRGWASKLRLAKRWAPRVDRQVTPAEPTPEIEGFTG